MAQDKRRFARFNTELSSSLYLCKKDSNEKLAPPVKCQLCDLSRCGAGIITTQVIVGQHHLFFSTLESDEYTLFLEIEISEPEKDEPQHFVFPVRPICFNRLLDQIHNPFKIGFEFNEKLSDDILRLIKKQCRL